MSINEVYDIIKKKKDNENLIYNNIYDKIRVKINNCALSNNNICIYTIPIMIFGSPLINIDKTKKYIMNKLTDEGFNVYDLKNNTIIIKWENDKIKKKSKISFKENEYENENNIYSKVVDFKNST